MIRRRKFAPALYRQAVDALSNVAEIPREVIAHAYAKWYGGLPSLPCKWMHEHAIAIDCNCPGHLEQRCYYFFDQMVEKIDKGELADA